MTEESAGAGILPYTCRYENSRGEVLRLDRPPYLVQTSGLFDYQWSLTSYDRALRDGGRVTHVRRPVIDKTLVLDVFADTQAAHDAALNRLHDVLEADLCTLTPGKLWVNNRYIRCFAYTSAKTASRDWTTYTVAGLTLKVVSPAWTAEETVTLLPASEDNGGGKNYPGRYPYRYPEGRSVCRWVNETASDAPMIIRIFGACSSPSVYIGGNEYSVSGEIPAGSYAVIDQRDKRIELVAANGARTNLFGRRKKSVDNFLYAPPGQHTVSASGLFAVEVTFLTQRSEPEYGR